MACDLANNLDIFLYGAVFFPMAAALAGYVLGRRNKAARDYFAWFATGAEFLLFLVLTVSFRGAGEAAALVNPVFIPGICGQGMVFCLDGFRLLYGTVAAFAWFLTTLFSRQYFTHYRNRNRYYFFLLMTLGATEGVFLSGDFFTLFIFFEIMSFTSFMWVAHDERKESLRAADTYLAIAVIGGMVMLMGIFLLYAGADSEEKLWAAGLCMLVGFGAKAGAFPLHIWLPKAHPVAPAPASALLSGILTKAGVFGILLLSTRLFLGNLSWGTLILLLGTATMIVGAVLALFSVDLKRTLACSSVSQIGFVLVGVGMAGLLGEENGLAVRGSILHMVNHSLIKLVLFLAAGVVFMNVHKLDLNEIRGFGRKKPLLHFAFLMGALGISGVPFWNGYVSKTMLHESIVEYSALLSEGSAGGLLSLEWMRNIEWAFLISGGFTVAYMLKLYVAVFWEKNRDAAVQERFDALKGSYANRVSGTVLAVSAAVLPVMGFLPGAVMGRIADLGQTVWPQGGAPAVSWFSPDNLKGAAVSVGIGALLYLIVVRGWMMKREEGGLVYVNRWKPYLDLEDVIYRPLLRAFSFLGAVVCRVLDSLVDGTVVALRRTVYRDSRLPSELEEGTMLTSLLGRGLNALKRIGNRSFWKKKQRRQDYEHKLALLHEELAEDAVIVARSLSFGLLLFCVGLIVTVAYLLWMK